MIKCKFMDLQIKYLNTHCGNYQNPKITTMSSITFSLQNKAARIRKRNFSYVHIVACIDYQPDKLMKHIHTVINEHSVINHPKI